jgi:ADP-ribose pyrophosphatase
MPESFASVELAATRYLRLVQEGPWTYAQRPHISGAVAIAAVTDAGELLLVDQYRIPVHGRVIELPAGLVGDEADRPLESPVEAARRELLEETGYAADRFEVLTQAVSSAGLTDEAVHLVLAKGLTRVGDGGGVDAERIVVHPVPLPQVPAWLSNKQAGGWQVDYKVFAALYFLQSHDVVLHERKRPDRSDR